MTALDAPADLILANARVLTLDPAQPCAEAVAVRAGRILAVGTWATLRHLVGPATAVVDAACGVVVPAFHDAHLHLLRYARAHTRLDCRGMGSLAGLQAALAHGGAYRRGSCGVALGLVTDHGLAHWVGEVRGDKVDGDGEALGLVGERGRELAHGGFEVLHEQ